MKKSIVFIASIMTLSFSTAAEPVRMVTVRADSMSELGAAISGLSLAVEQPMVGMMAFGALQQLLSGLVGQFEQNKPLGLTVVGEFKKNAESDGAADEYMDDPMAAFGLENAVPVLLVPVPVPAEKFFADHGVTNDFSGAHELGDVGWVRVRDGYAIISSSAEATDVSKEQVDALLSSKLGQVVEVAFDKSILAKFVEVQAKSNQADIADLDEALAGQNDFTKTYFKSMLKLSELQSMRSAAMVQQIDSFALGLSFDPAAGLGVNGRVEFAEGSKMAKAAKEAKAIDPALLDALPGDSLFAGAYMNTPLIFEESRGLLEDVAKSLSSVTNDVVRSNVEKIIQSALFAINNSEGGMWYADNDSAGRPVLVGKDLAKDVAGMKAASDSSLAALAALLEYAIPGQKFAAFRKDDSSMTFNVSDVLDMVNKQMKDDPIDDASLEKIKTFAGQYIGEGLTMTSTQVADGRLGVVKSVGSDYAPKSAPVASPHYAALLKDNMPAGKNVQPIMFGAMSMSRISRGIGNIVASAIKSSGSAADSEGYEEFKQFLDSLPASKPNGVFAIGYAVDNAYQFRYGISADEIKWFAKFFAGLGKMQGPSPFEMDDEQFEDGVEWTDEGDWEDSADDSNTNSEEAVETPAVEEDAPAEVDAVEEPAA